MKTRFGLTALCLVVYNVEANVILPIFLLYVLSARNFIFDFIKCVLRFSNLRISTPASIKRAIKSSLHFNANTVSYHRVKVSSDKEEEERVSLTLPTFPQTDHFHHRYITLNYQP